MSQVVDTGTLAGLDYDAGGSKRTSISEARQSIDDLVGEALRYRNGTEFQELVRFVAGFRELAPFNAMLVHVQRPGATFVLSARRWREDHGRVLKPGAQPLVILQHFAPVMFVYDVSDTVPLPGAPALPSGVDRPFDSLISGASAALSMLTRNAALDGVRVTYVPRGSQAAGSIKSVAAGQTFELPNPHKAGNDASPTRGPVWYDVEISHDLDDAGRYATLLHELAHLYCGHVGTPNEKWWPARPVGSHAAREVEAETAPFIAARRLDTDAVFPPYLDAHLGADGELPSIGLDRVLKVAGDLERMSRQPQPPRDKPRDKRRG